MNKYTVKPYHVEEKNKREGTTYDDFHSLIPNDYTGDIIVIDFLFIEKENRRKGEGSKELSNIVDMNGNSAIFIIASPTINEFPERPTREESDKFFEIADKFYTKNNFKSINFALKYDTIVPYVYVGNEIGSEIYNKLEDDFGTEVL